MNLRTLVCGFLLHMPLLAGAPALAQSLAPIDGGSAEVTGFDYDKALATSQAALGVELSDVDFVSVDGRNLKLSDFRGKPLVLSMIFTSCHQICPMTTRHLSEVVEKARDALGADTFEVAVVGFDTPVDTPDAMRYFATVGGTSQAETQVEKKVRLARLSSSEWSQY